MFFVKMFTSFANTFGLGTRKQTKDRNRYRFGAKANIVPFGCKRRRSKTAKDLRQQAAKSNHGRDGHFGMIAPPARVKFAAACVNATPSNKTCRRPRWPY
jgi:hypothetical protein